MKSSSACRNHSGDWGGSKVPATAKEDFRRTGCREQATITYKLANTQRKTIARIRRCTDSTLPWTTALLSSSSLLCAPNVMPDIEELCSSGQLPPVAPPPPSLFLLCFYTSTVANLSSDFKSCGDGVRKFFNTQTFKGSHGEIDSKSNDARSGTESSTMDESQFLPMRCGSRQLSKS